MGRIALNKVAEMEKKKNTQSGCPMNDGGDGGVGGEGSVGFQTWKIALAA